MECIYTVQEHLDLSEVQTSNIIYGVEFWVKRPTNN